MYESESDIGKSVDGLAKLEVLRQDEEQPCPISGTTKNGCITTALKGLFPEIDTARVRVLNTIPSYRENLGAFPRIASTLVDGLGNDDKYVIHFVGHCVGVCVADGHVDCWNSRCSHGVRLKGEVLLGVCKEQALFLQATLQPDTQKSHIGQMRAWPYRQERRGHGPTKKNLSYR